MIVFDSSTLILLAKIELLELFISNYPERILIPGKVKKEVCVRGREETPLINKMIEENRIKVLKVKNKNQTGKLANDFNLDDGEAEAILLAIQEGADLVATDDRNAIRACKLLKISFAGTITFLIRAYEKKLIHQDRALLKLNQLRFIGRYSKKIIENAEILLKGGDAVGDKDFKHSNG